MKIKVIDLLNKIANGEEVPEKIKYRNKIFIYDKDNLCYVVENYNEYDDLLISLSNHKGTDLNYEVEFLEEEKKIPEKIKVKDYDKCIHDVTHKEKEFSLDIRELQIRFNEIIDYVKNYPINK